MEGEITKVGCLDKGETNVEGRAGTSDVSDDGGEDSGSTGTGVEINLIHKEINTPAHPPQLALGWALGGISKKGIVSGYAKGRGKVYTSTQRSTSRPAIRLESRGVRIGRICSCGILTGWIGSLLTERIHPPRLQVCSRYKRGF